MPIALSDNMTGVINSQINKEFFSSYLYYAISLEFKNRSLMGFASWFDKQSSEEKEHGEKFCNYLIDKESKFSLTSLEAPESFSGKSPLEILKKVYDHEVMITDSINAMVEVAVTERDKTTFNFLDWFVNEQIQEVAQVKQIIDELVIAGTDGCALLMIDKKLGER